MKKALSFLLVVTILFTILAVPFTAVTVNDTNPYGTNEIAEVGQESNGVPIGFTDEPTMDPTWTPTEAYTAPPTEPPTEPPYACEPNKLYFDTNGTGWELADGDVVSFYICSLTRDELVPWGDDKLKGAKVEGRETLWEYEPANSTKLGDLFDLNDHYFIIFYVSGKGYETYDLLFDKSCLGHIAKCYGYTEENPLDSSKRSQATYWQDLRYSKTCGPRLAITSTGNVVGNCIEYGKTPYTFFTTFLTDDGPQGLASVRQYSTMTEQDMIDNIGSWLHLSKYEIENAFRETGIETTWVFDHSTNTAAPTEWWYDYPPTEAPTAPPTQRPTYDPAYAPTYSNETLDDNKLYFDTYGTGWELSDSDIVSFYVYSLTEGTLIEWGGKKLRGEKVEGTDTLWEYEPANSKKLGDKFNPDDNYFVIFYVSGKGNETHALLFDKTCLGHVARCDGSTCENPVDSSKESQLAYWQGGIDPTVCGPRLAITSTGNVIGSCVEYGKTAYSVFTTFLTDTGAQSLTNARQYTVDTGIKTEQKMIDDIGSGLGLKADDVQKGFTETGVTTTWSYDVSTLPKTAPPTQAPTVPPTQPPTQAPTPAPTEAPTSAPTYHGVPLDPNKLYFDTDGTGWNLADGDLVSFYIYSLTEGELISWGGKKLRGAKVEGTATLWGYEPANSTKLGNLFDPDDHYFVIFYVNGKGYETYALLFDKSCLGHVAKCDGSTCENPVDNVKTSRLAYWQGEIDPTVCGPRLAITSTGNVIGSCVEYGKTAYSVFTTFLTDTGAQSLTNARQYTVDTGVKTEQKMIDDIGWDLGLTASEVDRAFSETNVTTTWSYAASTLPKIAPTDEYATVTIYGFNGQSETEDLRVGSSFYVYTTLNASDLTKDGMISSINVGSQTYTDNLSIVDPSGYTMFPILNKYNGVTVNWWQQGRISYNVAAPDINRAFNFDSDDDCLIVTKYTVTGTGNAEIRNSIKGMSAADEMLTPIISNSEVVSDKAVDIKALFNPPPGFPVYFDATGTGWNPSSFDTLTAYIYAVDNGKSVYYATSTGYYKSDGVWAFDLVANGTKFYSGTQYGIVFRYGNHTYNCLLFDSTCKGATAYCDGSVCENPTNPTGTELLAFWRDIDRAENGPLMQITSMGNVIGTCLEKDMSGYDVLVSFITGYGSQSLDYVRRYVVDMDIKSEQQLIDDIGGGLGLTKQDVVDAFFNTGVTTTWDYTMSDLPGSVVLPTEPPTEAPTVAPTQRPTQAPTQVPTEAPTTIIPHTPVEENQIKIVADKTLAQPGDIINCQIILGPTSRNGVGSIQMSLSLPSDIVYVPYSGALAPDVKNAMGFDALEWNEPWINGYASGADYRSNSETLLASFSCKVNESAKGIYPIGVSNVELGSCETYEVYDDYSVIRAFVNVMQSATTPSSTEAPTEWYTEPPTWWYTEPPTEAPIAIIPHTPAGANRIIVVTDKTTAHPGDIINGQIFIGPDYYGGGVGSIQMRLSLPYGLDFVPGSGAIAPGVKEAMGFDNLDWTESTKFITGFSYRYDYYSNYETLLMTFQCRVSDSAYGTCTIGIDNIEIGSCETFEVYDYYAGVAYVTISYQEPTTVQEPTTPPYHGDGLIYFDASSAGWNGAKILFYIYDMEAGQELAAWGSKQLAGTAIGGGIYSFNPYNIGFVDGKQYFIIFNNGDTTAETYQLLLDSSCLGDTAYCTGNSIENPVDSNKSSLEAVWANNALGPRLSITSTGNVVGTTCPANTTKYDMFLNFLTSDGYGGLVNAMYYNPGKTQEEVINSVAVGLGLSDDEKNRALEAVGLVVPTQPPTEPPVDSYGYTVGAYYLTGNISGDNSGTSAVHKDLKFKESASDQMILENVKLKEGDVVRVARYNGGNTFTVYPDGMGRDVTITQSGKYDFYFKPYEMGNANYWYITPSYKGPDTFMLGDIDGDGEITSIDATYILRYNAEIDVWVDMDMLMHGDVDGSGDLEIVDATFIQRWLAEFNVPYDIGEQTTA